MRFKKVMSLALTAFLTATVTACSSNNGNSDNSPSPSAAQTSDNANASASPSPEGGLDHTKELEFTVFSTTANYAGEQTGWYGKILKDKFNIKLNIIASNLDGGQNKIAAMMASGNLGDIVVFGSDKTDYPNAIKGGLLLDWTKDGLLDKYGKDIAANYPKAIEKAKIAFGDNNAVYGLGHNVATNQPGPSEGKDLTWGPELRWDLYQQLGAPEINTPEDYLPLLKKMQEMEPKTDQGKKTYAFSLWSDWDGNYKMTLAKQFANMYGYDENGATLLYAAADEDKYYEFLSDDSWYMKSLKLYFEANQMGLVDPDSMTQKFDDVVGKYKDGRLLFSWFPWLGSANYNTPEHVDAGKGFMTVPFKEEKVYSWGFNQYGNDWIMAIGSKAKDPERIMEFINWLYTPEGAMLSSGGGTAIQNGPQGLTWDLDKDGKPYVTDFGWQAYADQKGTVVPDEFGGGTFYDGQSQINYSNVAPGLTNPETGEPYDHNLWTSSIKRNPSKMDQEWRDKYDALTPKEYFVKNNMIAVAPQGFTGKPPIMMDKALEQKNAQIGTVIQQYSWKMVFAKDEAQYNKFKQEMMDKVKGLGYDEVLAFSIKKAEELFESRKSVQQ